MKVSDGFIEIFIVFLVLIFSVFLALATSSGENTYNNSPADPTDPSSIPIKHSGQSQADQEGIEEKPVRRTDTSKSITSEVLKQRKTQNPRYNSHDDTEYGIFYILKRMAIINKESWRYYLLGFLAAMCTGMVFPAFGIVYGGFSFMS